MTAVAEALADRYRLLDPIGRGGMAEVYAAEDLRHARRVALKLIAGDRHAPEFRERFLREVQVAARLSHPHIVPVFDSGEAAGRLFYVMPLIAGATLRARLLDGGPLEVAEAVRMVRQVAEALDYAHREGIVHRDVKPENILLCQGHALVTDFGIARVLQADTSITATGVAIGTPTYMSPEQLLGEEGVGPPTDVFALGCVLYEILAGEPPYRGAVSAVEIARRLATPPPALQARRPDVPPAIAAAAARAMAPQVAARFRSAQELAQALDAAGAEQFRAAPAPLSLLVRPFDPVGADPSAGALADGLTEEVIADLANVRALRVISRTTAMRYKGTTKDARTMGTEVGVRYVVSGSVRQAGGRIRVTSELVDTLLDAAAWNGKFEGTTDDPFDLQERVARSIVNALDVRVTPDEERRLAARPIPDARAYEAYRLAMHEIEAFSREGLARGDELLREALAKAGENALLYAARGQLEWQYVNAGFDTDPGRVIEAERWLSRALAIEPEQAQALTGLAWIRAGRGELAEALRLLGRALRSDPTDSNIVAQFTVVDWVTGRWAHLRAMASRLAATDPLHLWGLCLRGALAAYDGDLVEMDRLLRAARSLDPKTLIVPVFWAILSLQAGDRERAFAIAADGEPSQGDLMGRILLAVRAVAQGSSEEAASLLSPPAITQLLDDPQWCWHIADVLAVAGQHSEALDVLERGVARGLCNMQLLERGDACLTPLRDDPRFAVLLERARHVAAGLPPDSADSG